MGNFLIVLLFAAAFIMAVNYVFRWEIIYEYERGLKYRRGKFKKILGPGRYWYFRSISRIDKVDARPIILSISGQEIPSSDGVAVKISAMVTYEIIDPYKAINGIQSYSDGIYSNVQMAMRKIVCEANIDDLLEKRQEVSSRLLESCSNPVAEFGINLKSVEIKDIIFPGDLKKIFANVVKARKEGLAILERARGETAALRNLANAAKMIEDNPNLLQLRALQTVGETTGNTIVFGVGSDNTNPKELKVAEVVK